MTHYATIDHALGERTQRHFGDGHRRSRYEVRAEHVDLSGARCRGSVVHDGAWSHKAHETVERHLSTVDAVCLTALALERALESGPVDVRHLDVTHVEIRAAAGGPEDLADVPVAVAVSWDPTDARFTCSGTVGSMRVRLRAEERLAGTSGFVSDGSVLSEWAYAAVRARIGLNPDAPLLQQVSKPVLTLPALPFLRRYVAAYGALARLHTRDAYDQVIHLRPEVPMDPDGHRPVSERYRVLSDRDLLDEMTRLGLPLRERAALLTRL
ncbi:AvrD family protein [Sanguibacter massiliensis]|uniref:AvrD family protein n=1 Tax=Sanguibacter massiliensis TaxID=1973217 RepID=UPI000C84BB23|nr:AvrD family protein [Sanguibacter massiliensis]